MSVKQSKDPAGQKLFRSISEVSALLDVKPHVLRYWETQFPSLRPRKNRAGSRMYRPEEIELIGRIKDLLYARRFTIEGARRKLAEERRAAGGKRVTVAAPPPEPAAAAADAAPAALAAVPADGRTLEALREVRDALRALARELRGTDARPAEGAAAAPEEAAATV